MLWSSTMKAQKGFLATSKFASWQGNNFVPAATELFKAKVLGKLQNGSQMSIYKNFPVLEQTKFL